MSTDVTGPSVAVDTESELVRVHGCDDKLYPVYVHKHLLYPRFVYLFNEVGPADAPHCGTSHTVSEVPLGRRARVLWSRWLYGQPMWNQRDCGNPDEDLRSLVEIYDFCVDSDDKYEDLPGINAAMDAIRTILVNDVHVPLDPLSTLLVPFSELTLGRTMLLELLVYTKCATEGKTRAWLEQLDHELEDGFPLALSLAFAEKAMHVSSPNPMECCRYHIHQTGELRCHGTVQ